MADDRLTHASFFSGVGGLDMGLERAGWRTVSFSEIDPYASAVLGERWPGVPNLGDITSVARPESSIASGNGQRARMGRAGRSESSDGDWRSATLWSGGFPCQDLSVAGKRRGMGEGTRSGLAYAFLDLVGRHRPQFVLLENVPGLLSSHGGRDMAALIGALVELGYGVGYRVLDARHFGVPQRRRRVFILGITPGGRAGAERAAEVLSVGSRCRRHPPTGVEAGPGVAAGTTVGALPAGVHGFPDGVQKFMQGHFRVQRQAPDSGRVRAPDGLAGRLDGGSGLAVSENQRGEFLLTEQAHQLTGGGGKPGQGYSPVLGTFGASGVSADPLLPLGLDSHRYRCCGNGVVSDVAEWIGLRLAEIA